MTTNINININFTEKALELRAGLDDAHFSYDGSVPFPGLGDLIAFPEGDSEQVFVIAARKFTFTPGQVNLQIVLDVPN